MKNWIPDALKHLRSNDSILSGIIGKIGECKLERRKEYFKSLVRSIISQQISVHAARSIRERLFKAVNNRVTSSTILKLKPQDFKKIGISPQKQSYIKDLSTRIQNRELNFRRFVTLSDDEIIDRLTQVRGIGKWTAEMFLIFSLNRQNILPVDDLGVRRAMMVNYKLKQMPQKHEMVEIAKNWEPYRSVGSWYMWKSLEF